MYAKLPALRLARHAYLDLIASWRGLVQVGGLWLILPWILYALDQPLLELLGDLAMSVGIAAVAVAWHRRILLQEPLPARFAPVTALVGRYMAFWVVVVAVVALPGVLLALLILGALGTDAAGVGGVLVAILSLLALAAAMRLQLVFPAAAIGERTVTLSVSWRATRGNAWRLLAGMLVVSLPPAAAGALLSLGLGALADASGSLVLGWLGELAPVAGAWVQAPLLAAFLSYAYLFLRQRTQALEPQAQS
jgi:hypothetical protein